MERLDLALVHHELDSKYTLIKMVRLGYSSLVISNSKNDIFIQGSFRKVAAFCEKHNYQITHNFYQSNTAREFLKARS